MSRTKSSRIRLGHEREQLGDLGVQVERSRWIVPGHMGYLMEVAVSGGSWGLVGPRYTEDVVERYRMVKQTLLYRHLLRRFTEEFRVILFLV